MIKPGARMKDIVVLFGLGAMGREICERLLAHGVRVRAWNRTPARAAPFQQAGFSFHATPVEAARTGDIWITLLGDAPATVHLWRTLTASPELVRPGVIWVQSATLDYSTTLRLAGEARARGILFCDAPVLGGREEARRGELLVLAGGENEVLERLRPLFETYAGTTLPCGPVGRGTLMKLAANLLLAHLLTGLAEWMNFGLEVGFTPESLWAVLRRSKLCAPMMAGKWDRFRREDFHPSFRLRWMRKDLHAILDAAHAFGAYTPMAQTVKSLFDAASGHGLDDEDYSAVYQVFRMLSRGGNSGEAEAPPEDISLHQD